MSFQAKLSSGEFAVLAEMNTPKGIDISELITNVRYLKSRIDAIVIPDMDNGVMHMSALAGGALMRQQGIELLIHVYGRDRNRMALQGDLLAAHVLGIHNLLVVQGEDMANGDHQDAFPVNDLDEIALLRMVGSLTRGSTWPDLNSRDPLSLQLDAPSPPLPMRRNLNKKWKLQRKKSMQAPSIFCCRRYLMPSFIHR